MTADKSLCRIVQKLCPVEKSKPEEYMDWLSCCFGGYFDMDEEIRKPLSEDAIFDCTCRNKSISTFKPEWNGSLAQFPTALYANRA
ncbi:hypothetical protein [Methanothrix sp.]|uniref:hypothetical protein n=1 Tax=Methanothrix sp. TaxID=90426 RepID=UPI003BB5BA3B